MAVMNYYDFPGVRDSFLSGGKAVVDRGVVYRVRGVNVLRATILRFNDLDALFAVAADIAEKYFQVSSVGFILPDRPKVRGTQKGVPDWGYHGAYSRERLLGEMSRKHAKRLTREIDAIELVGEPSLEEADAIIRSWYDWVQTRKHNVPVSHFRRWAALPGVHMRVFRHAATGALGLFGWENFGDFSVVMNVKHTDDISGMALWVRGLEAIGEREFTHCGETCGDVKARLRLTPYPAWRLASSNSRRNPAALAAHKLKWGAK